MQVKKKLHISIVFSAIMAVFIIVMLLLSLHRYNLAFRGLDLADEVLSSLYAGNTLLNEYLKTGSEKTKEQWLAEYELTGELLESAMAKFADGEDKKVIQAMIKGHEATAQHFANIIANREKVESGAVSAEFSREAEDRLLTRVNKWLYENIFNIHILRDVERRRLSAEMEQTGLVVALFITILAVIAAVSSWTISLSIANRIRSLREGAWAIGEGNLDHRISIKGNDEFAELSEVFDAMAEKLTISYRELENEIAERKRIEESLQKSEERYRALVSTSSQVLYYMNPDWSEMRQLQGGSFLADTSEPKRNWLQEYIHPDDQEKVKEVIGEAVRAGTVYQLEHRVRRADGTLGWARSRAVPLRNAAGKIVEWFGAASDITEQKRAEEALRKSEQLLRNVLDNLVALVGVMTPEGILVGANRTALSAGGLRAKDVIGKPIEETYWWSWSPQVQQQLREAVQKAAEGRTSRYDVMVRMAEGKMMTIDFMLAPLFDEQGRVKYLIPSAIDITDRKKAEEEREQLIRKLEEAIKELEGFTYSVSHDLRAPIRHLSSYAHLLHDAADPALDEKSRNYIKIIANASEKLGIQVDELLEFSRMGRMALKKSRVDLNMLIRDMVRIYTEANQDRDIEWNIHPLPVVAGDPTMLQLVFANLIGNGVKYTRNRPKVIIEIGSEDNEANHIIYVKDNGIGFDMKYYDKLFGIFQRLHISEEFEGTGIGLANVQRIIQRHGGRVWADSRIDKGATFYISLPKMD